jgi:hypothetical protein
VRLPLADGLNVTLIVQWAPAATDLPHVLVCAKLLLLVPLTARLVILKAALPVLLRVTVRAVLGVPTCWLPKAKLVGERLTAGVPLLKKIVPCGLPLALSEMLKASAMQAVERITAFARRRCTGLVSIGDASRACALPIPGRVLALQMTFLDIPPHNRTQPRLSPQRRGVDPHRRREIVE